jgi:hypothetical protein
MGIDKTNLYIDQVKSSDGTGATNYTFNLLDNPKIETEQYIPLSVSDIQLGSKVVAQGKIDGGNITIKRIIYFGIVVPQEVTATTTEEIATSTASTTPPLEISSSTDITTTESSKTDSGSQTNMVDNIKSVFENVIDSIVENHTGTTSNSDIGTSTLVSSSTEEVSTSTDSTVGTSTSIIEKISDSISQVLDSAGVTIKNTIDAIVEIVAPNTAGTTIENSNIDTQSSSTESYIPVE